MDRFLMHVMMDYPDPDSEVKVIRLVRGEEQPASKETEKNAPTSQEVIFKAREEIHAVKVSENIERYIVDLINATRYPEKYGEDLDTWLDYGASPRVSLAFDKLGRVNAWLNDREFVNADDIRAVAHDVLRHRIVPSYEANAEGISKNQIIDELLKLVAVA